MMDMFIPIPNVSDIKKEVSMVWVVLCVCVCVRPAFPLEILASICGPCWKTQVPSCRSDSSNCLVDASGLLSYLPFAHC